MFFIEILKAIAQGIVEGITEWLPVSSTGHILLLDAVWKMKASEAFFDVFKVVIQLGAILAVILLFFHKLNPFSPKKDTVQKKDTWQLWFKVVVAVLPSAVIGLLLDDWMDEHLYNFVVVAIALIVYGIAFILYVTQVWTPTLTGIALLFGIGNAFDSIVSFAAYRHLLKKQQIRILDV